MDIWTEQLQTRHLPILENWAGRSICRMTASDFPEERETLSQWLAAGREDPFRLDCLVSVYETPVGISGLRRRDSMLCEAELYLVLGESGYNSIRTGTYAALQMLDRAFRDCGLERVNAEVYICRRDFLEVLVKMGFIPVGQEEKLTQMSVEKGSFYSRRYLF